jgi:3-phosphoshikimate 1-carboxyvinyltransferase
MTKSVKLLASSRSLKGSIKLTGSKSIANRVLLIRALCDDHFEIDNISESDDTQTLISLLSSKSDELDAHHAGTTYRFMTAYLAIKGEEKILTGSSRMKQRPIGPLVDALNSIGGNVTYLENEGYPPLKFGAPTRTWSSEVTIPGNISSQYLSAMLMIAPMLPNGLKINISDDLVSRPYLEMTLSIMGYFGITHTWEGVSIHVANQKYQAKRFFVEADWSAASYYYSLAALSDEAEITLLGLSENSLQGDAAIATISKSFGVESSYSQNQVSLSKKKGSKADEYFEYDFIKQPDIAQTVFAMCAGLGVSGLFTGLQTLFIKETDRIKAFKTELAKTNVYLSKVPPRYKESETDYYMIEGTLDLSNIPSFDTYQDHRMAMALAPLSLFGPIIINEPAVVSKSYPEYWRHLQDLGILVQEVEEIVGA